MVMAVGVRSAENMGMNVAMVVIVVFVIVVFVIVVIVIMSVYLSVAVFMVIMMITIVKVCFVVKITFMPRLFMVVGVMNGVRAHGIGRDKQLVLLEVVRRLFKLWRNGPCMPFCLSWNTVQESETKDAA